MKSILQAQGIHHITLNGADKKTSISFWQDILGMRFIFEQPNLDDHDVNHLYFDCGDGTTVTDFTDEKRKPKKTKLENEIGSLHHVAFWVSQSIIRVQKEISLKMGLLILGLRTGVLWIQYILEIH